MQPTAERDFPKYRGPLPNLSHNCLMPYNTGGIAEILHRLPVAIGRCVQILADFLPI
jgi:hypothetical protein